MDQAGERDEGKRPGRLGAHEREELHRLQREKETLPIKGCEIQKTGAAFCARETASRRRDSPADRGEGELSGLRDVPSDGVNRTSFHDRERRAPSDAP